MAAKKAYWHSPPPKLHPLQRLKAQLPPSRHGHQAWELQTQLAKSLLPHWQAGFLSLNEEKERGGKCPGIRKHVEEQVLRWMAKGLFQGYPVPKARDPRGSQAHLREG